MSMTMAFLKQKKRLSSNRSAPKAKSASQISKTATLQIFETSSQRQREHLLAKHRREETERQNEIMWRLAQQKQELDRQRHRQEKQRLEQEEDRMREEQPLMLALNWRKIIEGKWQKQH